MHCTKSKVVLLHGIVYHMTYIYNYSGNWTIDGCKMVPCHWHIIQQCFATVSMRMEYDIHSY